MEWVAFALLAVAVIAGTALVATRRGTFDVMSEPTTSLPPLDLPEQPGSADVDGLRFGTALYGYAVEDVDAALDVRRDRLAEQERLLAGHAQQPEEQDGRVHPRP